VSADPTLSHLVQAQYGNFRLTDAVRPAPGLPVVPREGFRFETFHDHQARLAIPVLAAAVSAERLFDTFLALARPLGPMIDLVLETSHQGDGTEHRDLLRERIDLPIALSHLCDFEDLLTNDGCTGVALVARGRATELQFDEHKLLLVYAHDLERFEQILRQAGIPRADDLKLITEGEHLHSTDPAHESAFESMCYRLGVGVPAQRVTWE